MIKCVFNITHKNISTCWRTTSGGHQYITDKHDPRGPSETVKHKNFFTNPNVNPLLKVDKLKHLTDVPAHHRILTATEQKEEHSRKSTAERGSRKRNTKIQVKPEVETEKQPKNPFRPFRRQVTKTFRLTPQTPIRITGKRIRTWKRAPPPKGSVRQAIGIIDKQLRENPGLDFVESVGSDFEHAVMSTGFGKFHFTLLLVCGLIYADTALGITILSFVLPSAQCDFRMTSQDKGWLTAAPMLGMVIGSYFWGCLADTRGRKIVLVATLLIDGFCGLASSVSQYFVVFLVLRFFTGFALTGTMGIVFPYLGEFQPTKYREKILCWMELFWTVGIIALPGIAWVIIPLDINYESEFFLFRSWNLFVALCSVPSIILGLWLLILPESPKYLIEGEMFDEALNVFREMYALNTGNPPEDYPVKCLKEKVRNVSIISVQSVTSAKSIKTIKTRRDLKILLNEIWWQTKALCKPPHLKYTVLTCLIQFGLTTSYYTLMIWFPELFYRFEEFEILHPNRTSSVCEVSSVFVNTTTGIEEQFCGDPIEDSVFLHTLIIGLACIPTSICLPLFVHRLGAKFFIVSSLLVAGGATIGLYFVQTATQNLVLSCIFEALTSMGISTVYCIVVDLFPTNLRVMAAALSLTFGRGGALLGNLVFGFLIDMNCVVPIVLFSAMLFMSGLLCLALPSTGRLELD